jgi:hypothetical protein
VRSVYQYLTLIQTTCRSEVRRGVLSHIPLTPLTAESIFSRHRDVDSTVRKAFFTLLRNTDPEDESMDGFQLTQILAGGLADRVGYVQVAVEEVVLAWFDVLSTRIAPVSPSSVSEAVSSEDKPSQYHTSPLYSLFTLLRSSDMMNRADREAAQSITALIIDRREPIFSDLQLSGKSMKILSIAPLLMHGTNQMNFGDPSTLRQPQSQILPYTLTRRPYLQLNSLFSLVTSRMPGIDFVRLVKLKSLLGVW